MNEFLKRNKPVFIIGLITTAIFIGIIILAQGNTGANPTLRRIDNITLVESYTNKKGPDNAKVVLVEFSDYQCPACKAFHPIVESIFSKYSSYIQVAFRHFPLPQHQYARLAAIAAQAAGEQNKFWEYSNILFDKQPNLSRDELIKYAEELGLNVEKFKKDLDDPKFAQQIDNDLKTGTQMGLTGTPSFIVNNNLVEFTKPEDLENIILKELKAQNVTVSTLPTDQTQQTTQSTQTADNTQNGIKPTGEVVVINYTDNGFDPNNLKLKLGTSVKFVNKVDRDIVIRQLIDKYAQFREIKDIKKGESFTFLLTEKDLWTFKEDSMRHYGSIFVTE